VGRDYDGGKETVTLGGEKVMRGEKKERNCANGNFLAKARGKQKRGGGGSRLTFKNRGGVCGNSTLEKGA